MRIFTLMIFFFVGMVLQAQQITLFYKHYGTAEGLSDASCTYVFEDSNGYIWIGTQGGLNRFDGHRFIHYFHNPGDSTTLGSNSIMHISEGKDGNIWVGTYGGGISCIDKSNFAITNFRLKHPETPETRSNRIHQVIHLSDGSILVTTDGGLFIKEKTESSFFPAHQKSNIESSTDKNACLAQYHPETEKVWIHFHKRLHCYDVLTREFYHEKNTHGMAEVFSTVKNIITGRNESGKLFYLQEDGSISEFDYIKDIQRELCKCKHSKPTTSTMTHYSPSLKSWLVSSWEEPAYFIDETECRMDSTPFTSDYKGAVGNVRIRHFLTDSRGNEWIASGSGLYVRSVSDIRMSLIESGEKKQNITFVVENSSGCWAATSRGILNAITREEVQQYSEQEINYLYPKNESEIWVCHRSGIDEWNPLSGSKKTIMTFNDTTRFSLNEDFVQFIHRDYKNRIWIGMWSGNLSCVDATDYHVIYHFSRRTQKNKWPDSGLLSFAEFQDEFYLGFNGGDGVWKWNAQEENFEPYISSSQFPGLVAVIDDIHVDNKNIMMGTHGGGLGVYEKEQKQIRYLSRSDGLPGDYIYNIIPKEGNTFWLVTNAGICNYQSDDDEIRILHSDFAQEVPLFIHSGVPSPDNKTWFWVKDQLFAIYDDEISHQSIKPQITGFSVFGKIKPELHSISLEYDENFITIEFSAFNFTHQERIEYACQLVGLNDEWLSNGNNSSISYTDLSGGHYTFQVRARYNGGMWSEPAFIQIVIRPPFWKRWWFFTLLIMVVAGIIYLIYRYRLAQILKMQQMRNRISSDLHDDVGASLSSINIFSKVALQKMKDSPESAEMMLERISENATEMMDSMSDIVWSINPKNDTLNSLLNRIKHHANEVLSSMEIEMHYDIVVQEEQQLSMMARKNIYLICKEAINNIAKHSKANSARLTIRQNGQDVLIEITDNGIGMRIRDGKGGNGLASMENRAKEMGGSLVYKNVEPHGAHIALRLNITRISDMDKNKTASPLS